MGSRTVFLYNRCNIGYFNHYFQLDLDLNLCFPDTQGKRQVIGMSTVRGAVQQVSEDGHPNFQKKVRT